VNQPDRNSWVSIRSTWYGSSFTSSSTAIDPSGGTNSPPAPTPDASNDRFPPTSIPDATPSLSATECGPVSVRTDSGSNRVCRKCFCPPMSNDTSLAISGANNVTTSSCEPIAWCSAVMSLDPVNSFGPASAISCQSSRSTIRRVP
jgi:hypothetical protein